LIRNAEEQSERIATVREVSEERELQLFINARIDCFLSNTKKPNKEVIK